jgi:tetratricopeptide (TPR) repeat protein
MKRAFILVLISLTTCFAIADDAILPGQTCDQMLKSGANFADAVAIAETRLRIAPDDRDTWLCLGRAKGELGEQNAALTALQTAEKLSKTPVERIVALTTLGNQYQTDKAYTLAIDNYQQSLSIAREQKNARMQRINLNLIGESMQEEGNTAGALEQYQQGMKLAANDNERADSDARVAAAHSLIGNHDKAIEYQLKAMLLQERVGDLDHYANANIELGRICLVAKQYADAEKWLNKFLVSIAESGAFYWEAQGRYMLGKVKAARGNTAEAADQFKQSRSLAEKIGAQQLLKEISESDVAVNSNK